MLITGATGSVGRFAMLAARRRGVHIIAAVRESQAAEARALGAAEILTFGTRWQGPDFKYVIDTVGGSEVAKLCRHLAPGGGIFTAATTPIEGEDLPTAPIFVIVHNEPAQLRALAEAAASGELPVPVAKRLPAAQAPQAHRLVEAGGNAGKIVLEF